MSTSIWKSATTQMRCNLNALHVRVEDVADMTADFDGDDVILTVHLSNGQEISVREVGGVSQYLAHVEAVNRVKYPQQPQSVH